MDLFVLLFLKIKLFFFENDEDKLPLPINGLEVPQTFLNLFDCS